MQEAIAKFDVVQGVVDFLKQDVDSLVQALVQQTVHKIVAGPYMGVLVNRSTNY